MKYARGRWTNPSEALADASGFINLANYSDEWWSQVDTTDGTKGRVFKSDGTTRLACDWIDFDPVNKTGVLVFCFVGTLATSSDQRVIVYPPVSTNASVSASDTYGQHNAYGSNIIEYWQNPLSLSGRKGHITLASSGTITEASGPLGSAAACSSGAYFYAPESDIATLSPFTIISAVNFNTYCGCHPFVLGQDYRVTGNSRCDLYPSVTSVLYNARIYTNNYASLSESTAQSQWHQFAAVENVTSRSVYKDGVLKASNSGNVTGMTGLDSITVAWAHETAVSFGHIIWFNEALSEDYISFINDQIFDNSTFWGTWEYVDDAPTTYGVTYTAPDAESGTVPADLTEYDYGDIVTVLGNSGVLTRSGYTFAGWALMEGGSPVTSFYIDNDTTLYAVWTANDTSITCLPAEALAPESGLLSVTQDSIVSLLGAEALTPEAGAAEVTQETVVAFLDAEALLPEAGLLVLIDDAIFRLLPAEAIAPEAVLIQVTQDTVIAPLAAEASAPEAGLLVLLDEDTFRMLPAEGLRPEALPLQILQDTLVGMLAAEGLAPDALRIDILDVGPDGTVLVSFLPNGATAGEAPAAVHVTAGESFILPGNTGELTREGFVFSGWALPPSTALLEQLLCSGGKQLYAIWRRRRTVITFNANGGSGVMPAVSGSFGDILRLDENIMENPGHTFTSWNTKADGTGTAYMDGARLTYPAVDTELFAQWVETDAPWVVVPKFTEPAIAGFSSVEKRTIYPGNTFRVSAQLTGDLEGLTSVNLISVDARGVVLSLDAEITPEGAVALDTSLTTRGVASFSFKAQYTQNRKIVSPAVTARISKDTQ